jgi:hypothetical protein
MPFSVFKGRLFQGRVHIVIVNPGYAPFDEQQIADGVRRLGHAVREAL